MLDHDTDAYDKISRAFAGGQPSGVLTYYHEATRAATSPPGKNSGCSRPRSGRRSGRYANDNPHLGKREPAIESNQKGTKRLPAEARQPSLAEPGDLSQAEPSNERAGTRA